MTTIVANLEGMAADQRATDDGPPFCHVKKLHRIGDSIFGLAGDCHAGMAMIRWLQTPKRNRQALYKMFGEEVQWRYEFTILELSPNGLALWNAWGEPLPLLDKVYAIGTGAPAALAAVEYHGKSIDEAIRCAMHRDQYSGLLDVEPQVEWLIPTELKRRRRG